MTPQNFEPVLERRHGSLKVTSSTAIRNDLLTACHPNRVQARPSAFLSEDIGSLLKGGAKVCQQQLVEVLAPLVTEFALNLGREGATPIQRAFDGSLLDRVQAVELRIRSSPSPDSYG